jgi:hypothetical protein
VKEVPLEPLWPHRNDGQNKSTEGIVHGTILPNEEHNLCEAISNFKNVQFLTAFCEPHSLLLSFHDSYLFGDFSSLFLQASVFPFLFFLILRGLSPDLTCVKALTKV